MVAKSTTIGYAAVEVVRALRGVRVWREEQAVGKVRQPSFAKFWTTAATT